MMLIEEDKAICPLLIVDDNKVDRDILLRHLRTACPTHMVDQAMDGAEALEKIRTKTYGLMLLDWQLPRMNADQLLRRLQTLGRHLPVIVISGFPFEEISGYLKPLGVSFLHKDNLSSASLSLVVSRALAGAI